MVLLSMPPRIVESLVCDGIRNYLLSMNFFSPRQHSFRKGYSCIANLLTAVDRWTTVFNHKGKVDVIYLDFALAFDRVNYMSYQ